MTGRSAEAWCKKSLWTGAETGVIRFRVDAENSRDNCLARADSFRLLWQALNFQELVPIIHRHRMTV
jgi:hypothetical protein